MDAVPPAPPSPASPPGGASNTPAMWMAALLLIGALATITAVVIVRTTGSDVEDVTYTQYLEWLEDSAVYRVERNSMSGEIEFVLKDARGIIYQTTGPTTDYAHELALLKTNVPPSSEEFSDAGVFILTPR